MPTMMTSTGYPTATLFFWFLHWVGGTLWVVGIILGVAWAIRYLPPEKLKSVALWMFGIGLGLAILTIPASVAGWRWFFGQTTGGMMTVSPRAQIEQPSMMDVLLQDAGDRDNVRLP